MNTYKVVKDMEIIDPLLVYKGSYKAGDLIVVPDDHAGAMLQAGKIEPMTPGQIVARQNEERQEEKTMGLFRNVSDEAITYKEVEYEPGAEFDMDPKDREGKALLKKKVVEEL